MRNLLTLLLAVSLLSSCKEETKKEIILEPVEVIDFGKDSIIFKNDLDVYETIPNPKVSIKFVDAIDSLSFTN